MCWWVVEAFASCPAFSTHPFHLFTTSSYVADQKMIRLNPTNKRWLTIRLFAKLPQPLVLDIITDFLGWKSLLQFQRRAAIWSKQRWHIQSSIQSSIIFCCIHHHSTCCPTLLLKVQCSTPTVVDRHHHVGEGNDLDEREYYWWRLSNLE